MSLQREIVEYEGGGAPFYTGTAVKNIDAGIPGIPGIPGLFRLKFSANARAGMSASSASYRQAKSSRHAIQVGSRFRI